MTVQFDGRGKKSAKSAQETLSDERIDPSEKYAQTRQMCWNQSRGTKEKSDREDGIVWHDDTEQAT